LDSIVTTTARHMGRSGGSATHFSERGQIMGWIGTIIVVVIVVWLLLHFL